MRSSRSTSNLESDFSSPTQSQEPYADRREIRTPRIVYWDLAIRLALGLEMWTTSSMLTSETSHTLLPQDDHSWIMTRDCSICLIVADVGYVAACLLHVLHRSRCACPRFAAHMLGCESLIDGNIKLNRQ